MCRDAVEEKDGVYRGCKTKQSHHINSAHCPPASVLLVQRLRDGLEQGHQRQPVPKHVMQPDHHRRRVAPGKAIGQLWEVGWCV